MKQTQFFRFLGAVIISAALCSAFTGDALGDIIKTKDGQTYEGVITYEGDQMVKIRVRKSDTITETINVMRGDIAEGGLMKSAPDDVDYAKLKQLLPTPSLVTTSKYRSMIETGPQAFLNAYPQSRHVPEVEKIKKELDDELAKVDRGFIKLEGEWISPQAQQDFRELIDSRILNLGIKQKASLRNFIGALRDFERMEETYYGTPSFVASIGTAKQVLPVLGQRLQQMVANVDFENKKFEEDLEKMPEIGRAQVIEARKREEEAYKRRFEADKATGVKWYQVNQRDKDDLTNYIELVAGEIERLNGMDTTALTEQAEQLVKVDELLADGKLKEAKELLKSAAGFRGSSRGGGSSSRGKYSSGYGSFGKGGSSRTSRKTTSSRAKTSYVIALQEKIHRKEEALAAAKQQAEDSAQGAEAAEAIRGAEVVAAVDPTVLSTETAEQPTSGSGALTDLIASTEPSGKPEPAPTKSKPAKKKKPSAKTKPDDEEDEPRRTQASSSGGFRWTFQKIIIIVAVLLAITVGIMKMLGLGGARS